MDHTKKMVVDSRKRQLMILRQGEPWRYMAAHLFPELRSCSILIYKSEPVFPSFQESERKEVQVMEPVIPYDTIAAPPSLHDTVYVPSVFKVRRSFDMAVKTNMLYDVFLVPNIGMEFHLGKGWSLGGNWMYAWWNRDHRHRYWRLYGGNWIFADISDAVPLKGLVPDTTLVFADNSSPMTSKPGERVTWVASLAAHFGRR